MIFTLNGLPTLPGKRRELFQPQPWRQHPGSRTTPCTRLQVWSPPVKRKTYLMLHSLFLDSKQWFLERPRLAMVCQLRHNAMNSTKVQRIDKERAASPCSSMNMIWIVAMQTVISLLIISCYSPTPHPCWCWQLPARRLPPPIPRIFQSRTNPPTLSCRRLPTWCQQWQRLLKSKLTIRTRVVVVVGGLLAKPGPASFPLLSRAQLLPPPAWELTNRSLPAQLSCYSLHLLLWGLNILWSFNI